MKTYASWGRYPRILQPEKVVPLAWRGQALPKDGSLLCYGLGRSYGDSCRNSGGTLLDTTGLDRVIHFDRARGILRAEAGLSLDELLRIVVPHGWFPPVTPGTAFVTLGGAVANDIHGKNHHRSGTFGNFVTALMLRRSDGAGLVCSADENSGLFQATIGGLGLTGLIEWVELRLLPIRNPYLQVETIRFGGLDEFYALSLESEEKYEYLVAWVDGLAAGAGLGRGVFIRGRHDDDPGRPREDGWKSGALRVPFDFPSATLNGWTVRAFNEVYYRLAAKGPSTVHYRPFFYPLDAVSEWNRIYGARGFIQWQGLVPMTAGQAAVRELLKIIASTGSASFLGVMKTMGTARSPGIVSFTGRGVTLALDFPANPAVLGAVPRLNALVRECGGQIYPAKDACMAAADFQAYFPRWTELEAARDPAFSSSFWRRVTKN